MGMIKEFFEQKLRDKLSLLLDLENLQSPEQLAGFDDESTRNITSWEMLQQSLKVSRDRKQRYLEYDRMDENSDIKASLDAYAEESTIRNREKLRTVWVSCDNEKIVDIAHAMLDQIKFEDNITGLARSVAKYGDDFEQVFYDEERGVYMLKFIEPNRVDRIVDDQNRLRGYKVDGIKTLMANQSQALAQPWDFVHFKINGAIRDGWGESILFGVQKNFRILEQLETALALYRLARAADRNVFYVDVGTAPADAAYNIVEKWRQTYRKKKWFESSGGGSGNGMVDFKHNPIDLIEDIFWPVRKESQSRVEKLAGSNNVGDIADIEYFRNKVRYGLGIPPEYFGQIEGGNGQYNAAAGLVQQDMRFARKAEKIQRAIIAGVTRLIEIHLSLLGIPAREVEFKVHMEPTSYLAEMQRMEAMMTRVTVAQGLVETMIMGLQLDPEAVADYVMRKIMFSSDDELNEFLDKQAEVMAERQQEQIDQHQAQFDMEQQQGKAQTLSLFAKAKQGAEQKAKTPGGNSGVSVKKKKPSAKPKKKAKASPKAESEILPIPVLLEQEDDFLDTFEQYLAERKDAVAALAKEIEEVDDTILEIKNA